MSTLPYSLSVRVVTYNLHKLLLDENLERLLFPSSNALYGYPDIIAIGLQEMVAYPQAFLGESSHILSHYTYIFSQALNSVTKESYTQAVRVSLVGVSLFIFTRDSTCTPFIKRTEVNTVGLGWLWMGDKAAVGARILIADNSMTEPVSMCFVTAHLAAHNYNIQLRNEQFKKVCNRLVFSPSTEDHVTMKTFHETNSPQESSSPLLSLDEKGVHSRKLSIYDNDYTFFFGDLNYRLLLSHPTLPMTSVPDIVAMIRDNNMSQLLEYDQLTIEHGKKNTLNHFTESRISFPPTYKLYRETNEYNVASRIPGWCDRIFSLRNCVSDTDAKHLVVESYSSHEDYALSDHKPVSATFKAPTLFNTHKRTYSWDGYDSYWRIKQKIGIFADRVVGMVWWALGTGPGLGLTLIMSTIGGYWYLRRGNDNEGGNYE